MTLQKALSNLVSKKRYSRRSQLSWCLYDWANSAFTTVIITFVFSVFFSRGMVGDETRGGALWSVSIGFSGLFVAFLAPVLGAVADHSSSRKGWIFWFSLLCIVPCALLWFAEPLASVWNIAFVLCCVVLANVGFELSGVFYNAMLPHIAPPSLLGRMSGWAWGLGYIGGIAALALALFGFVGVGEIEPFFPVSGMDSANIRAVGPMVALWFLVFMIPLQVFTKDVERIPLPVSQALRLGWSQLLRTLKGARSHGNLVQFLVASALYRDGLNTLFAVGGIYAAGMYHLDFTGLLYFAIGLNVTAGLGAFAFSFLDDKMGSRKTILFSLCGLIIGGLVLIQVPSKEVFIAVALLMGIFIGPVQAASRTMVGRLAPARMITQTYGLFAFTGKSVAFLGPLAYGFATQIYETQVAGLFTILMFWVVGFGLLGLVREDGAQGDASQ